MCEEIAKKYLDEIRYFYEFLVNSVTREDYEVVKKEFGYEESYEEHLSYLKEGVPEEDEETLQHLKEFLIQYEEFQNDMYLMLIKKLNEKIISDPDELKSHIYTVLKDTHEYEQVINDEDASSEEIEEILEKTDVFAREYNDQKGIVKFQLKNTIFEINAHHNPLLGSLYSLLFSLAGLINYGEDPTHVV